jgi:hypothetical protein
MPEPEAGGSTILLGTREPEPAAAAVDSGAPEASRALVELLATSAHSRLRLLASIGLGAFGLGTLLSLTLPPLLDKPPRISLIFAVLCGFLTLLSAVMRWIARSRRRTPRGIVALALSYVVVAAWAMAAAEVLLRDPQDPRYDGVSGICIWIVLFPMLLPTRPRHALVTALLAASGLPLAWAVGRSFGAPEIPATRLIDWFIPGYFCAGLAFVASLSLHRLTAALARARARVRELGAYQLEERLGSGGMGEVWRARHRMLPRPAAVKFIKPAQDPTLDPERSRELATRFEREARAIALLESPHTIRLFDFGIDAEARFYYAMELLSGLDLQSLVARHGPQPPARVRHILVQICRSLAEAHAKGLVHRDIKPGNVMLCTVAEERDLVKVLDFGLVSVTQDTAIGDLGTGGQSGISGTPGYIAPELLFDGHGADARSDLYALGAVGYWLLTGTSVFPDGEGGEDLVAHSMDPPQDPAARLGHDLPRELCAPILRCLEKKPQQRPESAAVLRRQLESLAMAPWTQDDAERWWREHDDAAKPPTA